MKIFEKDGKINFVDHLNTFVGFDYNGHCCEDFGWSISKNFPNEHTSAGLNGVDIEGYVFDPDFFQQNPIGIDVEEGGVVVFKLTKDFDQIFLTLWNSHNGYYGHGFSMNIKGVLIREGCI